MQSPWRRHHQPSSKESNLNQSLQIILQPQNLSGTLSECCPRTSRLQSTTTIISKASPKTTKVEVKSKSLLSLYRAKDQQDPRQCDIHCKTKPKSVLCECLKADAGSQYETFSLETFATPDNTKRSQEPQGKYTSRCNSRCNEIITANVSAKIPTRPNIFCQCPHLLPGETDFNGFREKQILAEEMSFQPTSEMAKPNVMFTDNTNENTTALQNLSAQTSDHSVNLGQILNEHPLFLKVVHVSK